jgi:hypothetical protein
MASTTAQRKPLFRERLHHCDKTRGGVGCPDALRDGREAAKQDGANPVHVIALMPVGAADIDLNDMHDISEGSCRSAFGVNVQMQAEEYKTRRRMTIAILVDTANDKELGREFEQELFNRAKTRFGQQYNVTLQTFAETEPVLKHKADLVTA